MMPECCKLELPWPIASYGPLLRDYNKLSFCEIGFCTKLILKCIIVLGFHTHMHTHV